ncbi:MAG: rod shape-determining protein MreD [Firmicutes bacterium]|nr:rod shape-determining protein MreD [Bacillota bacterium]
MKALSRWGTWFVLYILALVVQTAFLPEFFPTGYVPSVVLPVTVLIGLDETPARALWAGFTGGLLEDILAGRLIGLNALTYALLGWAIAKLRPRIVRDAVFVPGILAGLSQLVVPPFQWVLVRLSGDAVPWMTFMRPVPDWILFAMLVTPALGGILELFPKIAPPRHHSYRSG